MTDPQVAVFMLAMFIVTDHARLPDRLHADGHGHRSSATTPTSSRRGSSGWSRASPATTPAPSTRSGPGPRRFTSNRIFDLLVNQTYSVMSNDALTAVPLFLFMGYIVERAEHHRPAVPTLNVATRHIPGSMAVAALVTCALFATATGIVGAVVTLMGLLAFPAMLKARYDVSLAAGRDLRRRLPRDPDPALDHADRLRRHLRRVGGPALRRRLAAGVPARRALHRLRDRPRDRCNPSLAPKPRPEELGDTSIRFSRSGSLLTSFLPLAVLILAVLGAILFGLATPSEAAAIGALGGLVLAAAYRALTWERLRESVYLDRAHLGDGLLALRRLVHLRLGLRLSRRADGDRRLHASASTSRRCSS